METGDMEKLCTRFNSLETRIGKLEGNVEEVLTVVHDVKSAMKTAEFVKKAIVWTSSLVGAIIYLWTLMQDKFK